MIERLRELVPTVASSFQGLQQHAAGELCGSCPKCGGTDRFIVYPDRDRFWCRQCGWKGDRIDLAAHKAGTDIKGLLKIHGLLDDGYLSKRFGEALDRNPSKEHLDYIERRGISGALPYLQKNKLIGFENGAICFPLHHNGTVVGIQRVPLDGSEKRFVKGSKGKDGALHLPGDGPTIVTEAAIDAISAILSYDCKAACTFSASTIGQAQDYPGDVVLFFDNDKAGRDATKKAAATLPGARAVDWSLCLNGAKDINDLFRGGHQELIVRMIETAKPFKVEPVKEKTNGMTAAELMQTTFTEPRWAVPGIIPEGLSILAGKPKKGKSIIALNLCIAITSEG
jgi:hypothetical protein